MFWKKKGAGGKDGKDKKGGKPSREELIAQATANARAARERLGDETIQKMAAALQKQQQAQQAAKKQKEISPLEQAKARIRAMDKDKVADHIRLMIDEDE